MIGRCVNGYLALRRVAVVPIRRAIRMPDRTGNDGHQQAPADTEMTAELGTGKPNTTTKQPSKQPVVAKLARWTLAGRAATGCSTKLTLIGFKVLRLTCLPARTTFTDSVADSSLKEQGPGGWWD
jgi:hypothetical protein